MDVIRDQLRRLVPALAPVLLAALLLTAGSVVPSTSAAPNRTAKASADGPCGEGVLGIAQQFNVFVQHDYGVAGTDVKGRAAAGGNVSVDSYAVGVDLPPDGSRLDLIAGADLTVGGGGAQAPNGSVTYGSTLHGSITTPNGHVAHLAPPFDMNVQFAQLASQATAIAALTPNGTAGGPSYAYDLTGTSATTNVFRIAATDLETAQVIRIRVPSGSSTIVVVTGPSYSSARFPTAAIQFWDGSQYVQLPDSAPPALEALRSKLLWDFPHGDVGADRRRDRVAGDRPRAARRRRVPGQHAAERDADRRLAGEQCRLGPEPPIHGVRARSGRRRRRCRHRTTTMRSSSRRHCGLRRPASCTTTRSPPGRR